MSELEIEIFFLFVLVAFLFFLWAISRIEKRLDIIERYITQNPTEPE